ncbi:MAG: type II toxin-antitoxin system VapC family toxin [Gaiellaceae bacterium MAG52_C11]|nr:type II toxin-antitoxin system VapC family toxin [Candidatus Gaiellasilicea maunaloa]
MGVSRRSSSELVVDASVAFTWFRAEEGSESAALILDQHERGELGLVVPSLLGLELVNAAARKWRWSTGEIGALVAGLARLRLRVNDPTLDSVAAWAARGLTAYDASYVALAEERGCQLLTADIEILTAAPGLARPL